jgi:beta-1,4-mannosyltransferase
MRVAVVVLGDLIRSPRMCYHAEALAEHGCAVDLIGYADKAPAIAAAVRVHALPRPSPVSDPSRSRLRFVLSGISRIARQSAQLLRLLLWIERPDVTLLQSPPAVPALLISLIAARLRRARLIVDWHNFGYSLLALRLGAGHPIVRVARWHERWLGRLADAHLCVSHAMQHELSTAWGIGSTVLYDQPAAAFTAPTPKARAAVRRRLLGLDEGAPTALIVSATSWTADEDLPLLLDAARRCDPQLRDCNVRVLIVITGEGPRRPAFEAQVRTLQLGCFEFRTMWLAMDDYAALLGAADLGVCLHRSASGVDLPMKLADMFGAGLPVCAYDYGSCLRERIRPGENGLLFQSSEQLAEQLVELLRTFPHTPRLDGLRRSVEQSVACRWTDEWRAHAAQLFRCA